MVKLPPCIGTVAVLIALAGCARPDVPLPAPVPPSPQAMEMSVTLHHCGLNPITYEAKKWEAGAATLFDATTKPASWRGRGTITEVSPTRLPTGTTLASR